jgi:hypothetical protein
MVQAPPSFVEQTLWPELVELNAALKAYLLEATQRIIDDEVHRHSGPIREQRAHPHRTASR